MIIATFNLLFFSVSMSLVVEGALAEHRIRALAANMARRFGPPIVIGAVVMVAAAPLILLPFGADYVREAWKQRLERQAAAGLFQFESPKMWASARTSDLEREASMSGLRIPHSRAALIPGRSSPRSSRFVPSAIHLLARGSRSPSNN